MAKGVNKPKQPKMHKQQKAKSEKKVEVKHISVGSTWGKVAGLAPWVSGQSSSLAPGSAAASSRRKYRLSKYKARGKKVIRPRIVKHKRKFNKPDKH